LIHVERNRYSVPASFDNRPVSVRVYADRLVIAAEGRLIAEHGRVIERSHRPGRTSGSIFDAIPGSRFGANQQPWRIRRRARQPQPMPRFTGVKRIGALVNAY